MFEFILYHGFYMIESIGIIAFALSGIFLARKKDFDFVGVFTLSCITSFGGGTLRDLILDIHPVYWVAHSEYIVILFLISFIFYFWLKNTKVKDSWLIAPDALGMSFFTITTAQLSYNLGYPLIIVAILSTIVATFGGILRDSLCKKIPFVFKKHSSLYATLSFLGASLFFIISKYSILNQTYIMILVACLIFLARLLSEKYKLSYRIFD
jgi:uncharacterized membrane protein YeiH